MDDETTVVATKDQVSAQLDEEAVVLSLSEGAYYGLNEVAAEIWSLVAVPHTIRALVTKVAAEYEVDEATARSDVVAFVEDMAAAGLVTVSDPSMQRD